MSEEKCQRCGEVGQDRRTINMECFYDMSELGIPFRTSTTDSRTQGMIFSLRVCKDCRAAWMRSIKNWFNTPDPEPEQNGYYIREFGTDVVKPVPVFN